MKGKQSKRDMITLRSEARLCGACGAVIDSHMHAGSTDSAHEPSTNAGWGICISCEAIINLQQDNPIIPPVSSDMIEQVKNEDPEYYKLLMAAKRRVHIANRIR